LPRAFRCDRTRDAQHRAPGQSPYREAEPVLAGGCALNCVPMARFSRKDFDDIFIQPPQETPAALWGPRIWHGIITRQAEDAVRPDAQSGSYLGPAYDDAAIKSILLALGARSPIIPGLGRGDRRSTCGRQGCRLVPGRMEYGPRALETAAFSGRPFAPICRA